MYRKFLLPTSLLAGTIIGAGVFALPFIFSQAGFITSLIYLLIGVLVYIVLYLLYADIVVRTEGRHRFIGYTRIYLGKSASWFSVLIAILGAFTSLTAYLVLSMSFSAFIFPEISEVIRLMIFWAIGSFAIFIKLKRMAVFEFFVTAGIIAIIAFTFTLGADSFFENFSFQKFTFSWGDEVLPFAPIFYALSGFVAIPSIVQYFRSRNDGDNHRAIRKAVIWGTALPAMVYALFVIGVIGLSDTVATDAVGGLVASTPPYVLILLGVLGLFSLITSYVTIGLDTARSLKYDLKVSHVTRALIVILAPFLLYAVGFNNFIALVSFTGGIFIVLVGMMTIGMWLRARKVASKPPVIMRHTHSWFIGGAFVVLLATLIHEVTRLIF